MSHTNSACQLASKSCSKEITCGGAFIRSTNNHHRNIKYLGRYLKRPALSMSRLKHYDGKEATFSYLNHKTKQYLRFASGAEDFIERLVQHIPDKGFRMIRYYGFLATSSHQASG